MRAIRTVVGLLLVVIGFLALLAGVVGLVALQHRDANGAVTTHLAPGLDVTLAVSRYAGWLRPSAVGLLVAGLAGVIGGVALLFVRTEPVLVVEAHRMVEFADRIADRLDRIAPGESLAVVRRTRGLDLTGELITVPSDEPPKRWRGRGHTPPELADKWAPDDSASPGSGADDAGSDGESPYVYTAT